MDHVDRRVEAQASIESMQINISVREHHAFGIGAGAAGVEEFGESVFVESCNVRLIGFGGGEHRVVILRREPTFIRFAIEQDDFLQRGDAGAE